MKIKEIRLMNIVVYQNGEIIYQGPVKDADEDIRNQDVQKMYFDEDNQLNIEIT